MAPNRFSNKKVALLGLSLEGYDSAQFFLERGAKLSCFDRRTKEELGDKYKILVQRGAQFFLGPDYLENLNNYDLIVRTPGMALFLPELIEAKKQGISITSQTKLFFELCPAPIIGVTGTKGKGTTTTLIGEIFKASGFKTYVGGNVGVPLLSCVDKIQKNDRVVLELSSFQLEDLTQSPHIAVVLGITEDHLVNNDPNATNFHKSKVDYIKAKKNLVRFQTADDFAVINHDQETSRSFAGETKGRVYWFSKHDATQGSYVQNNEFFLNIKNVHEVICKTTDLHLRGSHNWENVTAAITATYIGGATIASLKQIVPQFQGLEHRLEFFAEINKIKYYNDSFSTTPDTAIAALRSFSEQIILICGGSEKGHNFDVLGEAIVLSTVKLVIPIGATAKKIINAIHKAQKKLKRENPLIIQNNFSSMKDIIGEAKSHAVSGDVVVLSPACASFGLFKNYKERGLLFKKYVKETI